MNSRIFADVLCVAHGHTQREFAPEHGRRQFPFAQDLIPNSEVEKFEVTANGNRDRLASLTVHRTFQSGVREHGRLESRPPRQADKPFRQSLGMFNFGVRVNLKRIHFGDSLDRQFDCTTAANRDRKLWDYVVPQQCGCASLRARRSLPTATIANPRSAGGDCPPWLAPAPADSGIKKWMDRVLPTK
jgi:hypothetical protein